MALAMKSLSTMFFFHFLAFLISPASSSSSSAISYSDHCASIIPELNPTLRFHGSYPLLQIATTYYNGGERILGKKSLSNEFLFYTERSLSFQTTRNVYRTNHADIYKVEAYLKLPTLNTENRSKRSTLGQYSYYSRAIQRNWLKFVMNGYWSESSGKLCMVGSGSWISGDGKSLNLEAVLKLNYAKMNSTIYSSLVNGTLKSLSSSNDPRFFDPISIYAFPEVLTNYNYTLVTEEFDEDLPRGVDDPRNGSLGLQPGSICPSLSTFSTFELEYATGCKPSKNCTPFDGSIEYLPRFMSLYAIQCSADKQKLRYVMQFPNSSYVSDYYYHPCDLSATLIGEGSWDTTKNRLNIVACRILNFGSPQEQAHVGNCSIMLTLRFPATWTIRSSTSIVGQLWTNKNVQDSGFFDMIMVRSTENNMGWSQSPQPELKYEYTELENVSKLCGVNKPVKRKADRYPSAHSQDMRFDMSVKSSGREFGWGNAMPIFVGDELYENNGVVYSYTGEGVSISEDQESTDEKGSMNISYKLSFTPYDIKLANELSYSNSSSGRRVEITAEGIYDAETGHLCMVGCRQLSSSTRNLTRKSFDCEILVNFDFPPVNSRNRASIKGSIQSTRKETDPLYFKVLNMTSMTFYMEEAKEFVWRMDLEIIMVLISSTLACIFVALQLFHMKKHPEMLPSTSLVMLVILTLGHMIPLVINFEALFLENKKRSMRFMRGGWLEVNEVIVRLITLAAFLLASRLLQLAWTARSGNDNGSWIAERKVLFISSPVYIAGGLIAILVHWTRSSYENGLHYDGKPSILGDLRSYAGLVVDGFLLPQILLNIFLNRRENHVLSTAFYTGTTLVRLLPHAYDLYRIHKYAQQHLEGSYVYANPRADLYSTAWDIIISCGGLLLALIIYLQQRFGSLCILPRRFREFDLYNKVPTTSEE